MKTIHELRKKLQEQVLDKTDTSLRHTIMQYKLDLNVKVRNEKLFRQSVLAAMALGVRTIIMTERPDGQLVPHYASGYIAIPHVSMYPRENAFFTSVFHEMGHALLRTNASPLERPLIYRQEEIVVEAAAYMVVASLSLGIDIHSAPYIRHYMLPVDLGIGVPHTQMPHYSLDLLLTMAEEVAKILLTLIKRERV